MTTNTAVKTSAWVERTRALAPVVAQWRDAGLFRMSAPTTVGGAAVDEETALHVIEECARQDGSVGWNVMIASFSALVASYLPAVALRDVYRGGPSTVLAGNLVPQGAALPVPGGFRLTGR